MNHIIIALYKEDATWINSPELNSWEKHVYYKGAAVPKKGWKKLPNIGREAHTYLHHIIQHYDSINAKDIYVFTQGDPFDHCPEFLKRLKNCDGSYYDFGLLNTRVKIEEKAITRMGAAVFDWLDPAYVKEMLLKINSKTIKNYIKAGMAPIINVSHYAIFSVSGQTILSHPKSLYEKFKRHTEEMEFHGAYTMELLWRELFA